MRLFRLLTSGHTVELHLAKGCPLTRAIALCSAPTPPRCAISSCSPCLFAPEVGRRWCSSRAPLLQLLANSISYFCPEKVIIWGFWGRVGADVVHCAVTAACSFLSSSAVHFRGALAFISNS